MRKEEVIGRCGIRGAENRVASDGHEKFGACV